MRAALLSGGEAMAAWRQWRDRADIDRLDEGSSRILPLLARNLCRHGVTDPIVERLRGVHRFVWSKNTVRIAELGALLRSFRESGFETLVLKGSALIALYYPDRGLRPMQDVDVLVRAGQAPAAMALLRRLGWRPTVAAPERCLPVTHAHLFRDANGRQLDLHWHVLWECCAPDADEDFWANSVAISIRDVPTRALCPTHELLNVLVHGIRWNAIPPIRWIPDAMMILQVAASSIRWDWLVAQARARDLVLPVREGLRFLYENLHAPVPAGALATLRAVPVSRMAQREYAAKLRPWGLTGAFPILVYHHLRLCRGSGIGTALLGFPRYLQRLYGLARLSELPSAIGARLYRKLRGGAAAVFRKF